MAGRHDNSLAELASKIRYAFDPTAGNRSVLVGVGRIKFRNLVLDNYDIARAHFLPEKIK